MLVRLTEVCNTGAVTNNAQYSLREVYVNPEHVVMVREEQRLKQKLKTQLELVKECKRVPRIKPVPVEFAELINMCMKLGVVSSASFDGRDFDPKVSYSTELKEQYMKENPEIITLDNYKEKK